MKTGSIGPFEGISLKHWGKTDASIDAFEDASTGNKLITEYNTRGPAFPNISQRDNQKACSSFMLTTMQEFNTGRDEILKNQRVTCHIRGKKDKLRQKRCPLPVLLSTLDSQITDCLLNIDLLTQQLGTETDLIDQECAMMARNGANEIDTLYRLRKEACRKAYIAKIIKEKELGIKLCDEKIRLLQHMESVIRPYLTHCYLRISTYYKWAQHYNPSLPAACVSLQELLDKCESHVLGSYKDAIRETEKIRKELLDKAIRTDNKMKGEGENV